jgi:hypothetical protein
MSLLTWDETLSELNHREHKEKTTARDSLEDGSNIEEKTATCQKWNY